MIGAAFNRSCGDKVMRRWLLCGVAIFGMGIEANAADMPDFLRGSRLRPTLSMAGELGLRSLPPETMAFIDQLKKDRGI